MATFEISQLYYGVLHAWLRDPQEKKRQLPLAIWRHSCWTGNLRTRILNYNASQCTPVDIHNPLGAIQPLSLTPESNDLSQTPKATQSDLKATKMCLTMPSYVRHSFFSCCFFRLRHLGNCSHLAKQKFQCQFFHTNMGESRKLCQNKSIPWHLY